MLKHSCFLQFHIFDLQSDSNKGDVNGGNLQLLFKLLSVHNHFFFFLTFTDKQDRFSKRICSRNWNMWTGCMNKNFVNCPHFSVPQTLYETFPPVNACFAQESEIQPASTHQSCGAFVAQIRILQLALIFSNSSSKDVV